MRGGLIGGREINAVTINDDDLPRIFSIEGGYSICLRAPRTKAVVRSNSYYAVPGVCAPFVVRAQRASFDIPAIKGCVS